jgi:hypothetical protein
LVYNASYNQHRLSTTLFILTHRIVLLNTGGIRFDLLGGNFTLNDEKTVSPFRNAFMVLKDVVYKDAKIVLGWLNTGRFGYVVQDEGCHHGETWSINVERSWKRANQHAFSLDVSSPGYVTYDGTSLIELQLM